MYFMCSNDVVYCVCYFQQANNQIKESGGRFGKMIIKCLLPEMIYTNSKGRDKISILYRYAQPNRKYFCFKYEERKQHNDKWRELPATEFIIPMIVTAKAPKYKGYMRGYSH